MQKSFVQTNVKNILFAVMAIYWHVLMISLAGLLRSHRQRFGKLPSNRF